MKKTEDGSGFLKISYKIIYILGAITLTIGLLGVLLPFVQFLPNGESIDSIYLEMLKGSWSSYFAFGLLALGASQLNRHYLNNNERLGFLLRFGDKILFLMALFCLIEFLFMLFHSFRPDILYLFLFIVYHVTKIMSLVSLGILLRIYITKGK